METRAVIEAEIIRLEAEVAELEVKEALLVAEVRWLQIDEQGDA
jgi:hypothetical protein